MLRKHGTLVAATLLVAASAFAQDAMKKEGGAPGGMPKMTAEQMAEMKAYQEAGTPGAPHKAMAAKAGNYDVVVKSWHEPGGEAMVEKGTAMRSMTLDGRVMMEDFKGTMMGMPFNGHGMAGYDNVTGKYWHTWTDSMSTGIMKSDGTCDDKSNCAFNGSFNDPIKKGAVQCRMTTKWTSPTVEVFEMYAPGKDGKEMKMMEITYTKK